MAFLHLLRNIWNSSMYVNWFTGSPLCWLHWHSSFLLYFSRSLMWSWYHGTAGLTNRFMLTQNAPHSCVVLWCKCTKATWSQLISLAKKDEIAVCFTEIYRHWYFMYVTKSYWLMEIQVTYNKGMVIYEIISHWFIDNQFVLFTGLLIGWRVSSNFDTHVL